MIPMPPLDLTINGELLGLVQVQSPRKDAPFNPGNRLLNLSRSSAGSEARLEVRGEGEHVDFKLRVRATRTRDDCACKDAETGDFYAPQAYVRWRADRDSSITLGRQLFTWGPATFRSPSNPFYFDAGRTRPLRELSGLDALAFSSSRDGWMAQAALVIDSGHVGGREGETFSGSQTGRGEYRGTSLLRLDRQEERARWGIAVAKQRHAAGFLGAHASFELDDASRVWAEAGWGRRPWSIESHRTGPTFAVTSPSSRAATALVGAGHTFASGRTLEVEYLYDGHGLSRTQQQAYFATADAATAQLRGPQASSAAATLVTGLQFAPASLSRHYMSTVLQSSPQDDRLYWRAMWVFSPTDHSHQPSLYAEYALNRRVSLIQSLVVNRGPARSEFGSLLRHSLTMGLKVSLF